MIGSKGGRRRERRREEREDEEGVKVGNEAEDGDTCDKDRMLGKVRLIWGEGRWGVLMGREARVGAAQGDNRFGWGPIGGVSQNGGRSGEEMMTEREG